jgi:hypothetical protein
MADRVVLLEGGMVKETRAASEAPEELNQAA